MSVHGARVEQDYTLALGADLGLKARAAERERGGYRLPIMARTIVIRMAVHRPLPALPDVRWHLDQCLLRAESSPTGVASGRTGVRAIAAIPLLALNRLHRPHIVTVRRANFRCGARSRPTSSQNRRTSDDSCAHRVDLDALRARLIGQETNIVAVAVFHLRHFPLDLANGPRRSDVPPLPTRITDLISLIGYRHPGRLAGRGPSESSNPNLPLADLPFELVRDT